MINNNHFDYRIFETMILALKQQGLAIFAARYSYIGEYWYNEQLKVFEEERRLRLLDTEAFFKYDRILASIGRFSKTPSKVYVYENLQENKTTYTLRREESQALF